MYEYKVVPAPVRTVKLKGLKTTSERFAHLLAEALNAEAGEGWEYLRAETMPCEERKGLTGTAKSFQTVLVFRRPLYELAEEGFEAAAGWEEPAEPVISGAATVVPLTRQEPQLRPGGFEAQATRDEPVLRSQPPTEPGNEDDERR